MRLTSSFKLFIIIVFVSVAAWLVVVRRQRSVSDLAFIDSQMRSEIARLQRKIQESQENSARLKVVLMEKGVKQSEIDTALKSVSDGSFMREIPSSRKLIRDYANDDKSLLEFSTKVTVLIYGADQSTECVTSQVMLVKQRLPKVKIWLAVKGALTFPGVTTIAENEASTEGRALNTMIAKVKTPYFLYLSKGASVSDFKTDNGPGWLLHALEKVPDLDFIGGSILAVNSSLQYSQLDIQCHRMKMCYYVFAQNYEYKYSVGDVMICEETSTSFMGRVSSLAKVGVFDETLNSMVTTDFFWRAKKKAIVGLRPEVFFHRNKICEPHPTSAHDASVSKQGFMEKYELVRVRDSYGKITEFPDPPHSPPFTKSVWGRPFNYVRDGGYASPLMTEKLRYYTTFFDEFFQTRNITYFTDGGVPLGGIKMRNVLPWDTGDVDTGYWGITWQNIITKLKDYCKEKKVDCTFDADNVRFKKANGAPTTGLKSITSRVGKHHGAHDDLYTHEWEKTPERSSLMYVNVAGMQLPVELSMFRAFREEYGISYLINAGTSKPLECKVKGHHACVPEAFKYGGGHWKEFYCNLD